jgi:tetratricopeptide (TPR) repeat protein
VTPRGSALAAIASVVGETFDVEVLCNVAGSDESAVLDGLAELLTRRLVKEVGHARFQFAFTHHLVQSAIYERIAANDRRALHKRVAVVLERLPDSQRGDVAFLLAHHYDRASEAARAASWYLEAARRSSSLFANDEAFRDVERGLELATASDRLRLNLLLQREAILSLGGERAAQQRDLDELDSIVATLDDADALCEVVRRQVHLARALSDSPTEKRRIDTLTACAQRSADPRRRAEALQEEAMFLRQASSFAEAYAAGESALTLYRELNEGAGEVECLCLLSEIAATQGAPAEMQRYIDSAMASAQAQENKALIARAVLASAGVAVMRRDFNGALRAGEAALQLHREIGDREGEGEALARMATGAMMTQRPDEARRYFQQAGEILRLLGKRLGLGYLLFNTSALDLQLGRLDDAQESLDGAMAIFEALSDVRGRAVCAANVSMVRILRGDAREAKRYAERALADARAIASGVVEAAALSNLGNAERELREFDAAIEHINEALAIRRQLGNAPTFEELSDLARTQLEAGHTSDAIATTDQCLRLADESSHNTVWPHYCYWIAARVRRAAGDEQPARQLLARAEQLIRDQVNNIAEQKSRACFLDLPMNREIALAVSEGRWP